MSRLSKLALRAYPPSFRARYGDELATLADDLPASARNTADLFFGAVRTWLRPSFRTTDQRLQATVATTWVAWCAGFLVAPAIDRALLDPPSPGASSAGVRTLLTIGDTCLFAGWAVVLLGAIPVVFRAVTPAIRARAWTPLRPLLPVVALGAFEAVGLLLLGLTGGAPSSGLRDAAAVVWLIGFAVFVISLGFGPALALTRLEPEAQVLRIPTWLTPVVAVTLTTMTGCALAASVLAADPSLVASVVPVVIALAVSCGASLTAMISSSRGMIALRSR
jgi:hypothetical protein